MQPLATPLPRPMKGSLRTTTSSRATTTTTAGPATWSGRRSGTACAGESCSTPPAEPARASCPSSTAATGSPHATLSPRWSTWRARRRPRPSCSSPTSARSAGSGASTSITCLDDSVELPDRRRRPRRRVRLARPQPRAGRRARVRREHAVDLPDDVRVRHDAQTGRTLFLAWRGRLPRREEPGCVAELVVEAFERGRRAAVRAGRRPGTPSAITRGRPSSGRWPLPGSRRSACSASFRTARSTRRRRGRSPQAGLFRPASRERR